MSYTSVLVVPGLTGPTLYAVSRASIQSLKWQFSTLRGVLKGGTSQVVLALRKRTHSMDSKPSGRELYLKASPSYNGRLSVPVLWDEQRETVVNNESSEIIRMFYTEFDDFLPPQLRESGHPATNGRGFYPAELQSKIDAMNEWIYQYINNGVYRTGFATTQEAYEEGVYPLFKALDRVEKHLAEPQNQPYLFGEHITETDIRLYTTIARFDVAYHPIFKCSLKMIRHDYPNIDKWYRNLYWDESEKTRGAFKLTTDFQMYKLSYLNAVGGNGVPLPLDVTSPHSSLSQKTRFSLFPFAFHPDAKTNVNNNKSSPQLHQNTRQTLDTGH